MEEAEAIEKAKDAAAVQAEVEMLVTHEAGEDTSDSIEAAKSKEDDREAEQAGEEDHGHTIEEAEEQAADDTEAREFSWKEEPPPAEDAVSSKNEFTSEQIKSQKKTNENHADPRVFFKCVHHDNKLN